MCLGDTNISNCQEFARVVNYFCLMVQSKNVQENYVNTPKITNYKLQMLILITDVN